MLASDSHPLHEQVDPARAAPAMSIGDRRHAERRAAARAIVRRSYRDPQCTVGSVAGELHLSVRQLYRSFIGHESPSDCISRLRASTALGLLLADHTLPVPEVARLAGFVDPGTMRDNLHRFIGMGSRDVRRQLVDWELLAADLSDLQAIAEASHA